MYVKSKRPSWSLKCVKLRPNAQKELIFVRQPTAQLVIARVILRIRFTCELFLFDTSDCIVNTRCTANTNDRLILNGHIFRFSHVILLHCLSASG